MGVFYLSVHNTELFNFGILRLHTNVFLKFLCAGHITHITSLLLTAWRFTGKEHVVQVTELQRCPSLTGSLCPPWVLPAAPESLCA